VSPRNSSGTRWQAAAVYEQLNERARWIVEENLDQFAMRDLTES
jgi:hypothetical protein